MEELYRIIEEKIRAAGCPVPISGEEFYNDICDETEKMPGEGTYLFAVHKENGIIYEGQVEILEDQFDLHTVDITLGERRYHVDFDA